jgi:transposase
MDEGAGLARISGWGGLTDSCGEPNYHYPGAMLNYLKKWMDQLRWQRLPSFEKLAATLLKHVNGILNYCRVKVRFGVVEAINGNIV